MAIAHLEKFTFKKGQTGNAGGRPKVIRELLELARAEVPASFALAKKLRDDEGEDSRVRLEAAKFLCAYGLGTPPKEILADEADTSAVPSPEEAAEAAQELRKLRESTEH